MGNVIKKSSDPETLSLDAAYFANSSNESADYCAFFVDNQKIGKPEMASSVKVLVIGYDNNNRPLEPDIKNLKKTYSKFNWPMLVLTNTSKENLLSFLRDEREFKSHMKIEDDEKPDLLIIHVMAHGSSKGAIYTHLIREIFYKEELFEALNSLGCCKNLRKIFLLAPCRGNNMETHFPKGIPIESITTRVQSSEEDQSRAEFLQIEAAKYNTTFYYSTVEGHFAIHDTTGGTRMVQAWCNTLNSLSEDATLETVLTETNERIVAHSRSNFLSSSSKNAQTPLAYFSKCERILHFGRLCKDHRKPACDCSIVEPSSSSDTNLRPTKKLTDYSKIPKIGWYGEQNDDCSKRGPGKVNIFHDMAHEFEAQKLELCFKDNFPHFGIRKTYISEEQSIIDELERIASILEDEYVLHVFFLTKIRTDETSVSLPRFGVEGFECLQNPFLVENCPFMCGKPKGLYVLDCQIGLDFQTEAKKLVPTLRNTGQNYSDFLCFIARSKYAVDTLIREIVLSREVLLGEKAHFLDVITRVANSKNTEEHLTLIVSSLTKRLSMLEVNPIYVKPKFVPTLTRLDASNGIELKFVNGMCYDELISNILRTVRSKENKRAYVVCDDAGTGKTRLATEISKYLKDNRVNVIHIRAKEHSKYFSYKRDAKSIIKQLNNGKEVEPETAAIIIDAIDEICPLYRENILTFLETVVTQFLFVLAASRPQEREHLITTLGKFEITVLKFQKLSIDDVETFMKMLLRDVANGTEIWDNMKKQVNCYKLK